MALKNVDALAKVPIFSGLTKRQLRRILKATEEYTYPYGTTIVAEGALNEQLYVILEGNVKVRRGGRTIARMGPGEFFGEIAVIDGLPRTASVISDGPVRCLVLLRKEFFQVIKAAPQVAWKVLRTLATRLRERQSSDRA
jgi:CRP-like cAMP-binding protein